MYVLRYCAIMAPYNPYKNKDKTSYDQNYSLHFFYNITHLIIHKEYQKNNVIGFDHIEEHMYTSIDSNVFI